MREFYEFLGSERAVGAALGPDGDYFGLLDVDLRDPCGPDEDDDAGRRPRPPHQHRFAGAEFAVSAARSFHGCGDWF